MRRPGAEKLRAFFVLAAYLSVSAFEDLNVDRGNVAVGFCAAMLPLPNHYYVRVVETSREDDSWSHTKNFFH